MSAPANALDNTRSREIVVSDDPFENFDLTMYNQRMMKALAIA